MKQISIIMTLLSAVLLLVEDLLRWHGEHPQDWRKVWQLVQDKWDKDDTCASEGACAPFNIDASLNGAYIPERTEDTVLWDVYGLKAGKHTVRLVTTDKADARSKGKRISVCGGVTYR